MITKICTKCKEEKDISNFGKHATGKDGYFPSCKHCRAKQYREKEKTQTIFLNEKICTQCEILKPILEFPKNKNNKDGYAGKCKNCIKKYREQYYIENKEEILNDRKNYYIENKEDILKRVSEYYFNADNNIKEKQKTSKKKYYKKLAEIKSCYPEQLQKFEELQIDPKNSKYFQVKCTYCGGWFNPTTSMVQRRINFFKGLIPEESKFYCSNSCKQECPTFKQKIEKKEKPGTSREIPAYLRKIVFERDNWSCQICGKNIQDDNIQLHCHHIIPAAVDQIQEYDQNNCLTLCKDHHRFVHKNLTINCNYEQIKKNCKK